MFGYDQAVFSGVIVTEDFLVLHDLVGPEKTSLLSTITAIYDIGCFFGAIIAFTIGERLGRKKSIIIGTTIMTAGTMLMSASFSIEQMFVGRIILGYVPQVPCSNHSHQGFLSSNLGVFGAALGME